MAQPQPQDETYPYTPTPTPAGTTGTPTDNSMELARDLTISGVYETFGGRMDSVKLDTLADVPDVNLDTMTPDPDDPNFSLPVLAKAWLQEQNDSGWTLPRQTVSFENLTVRVKRHKTRIDTVSSVLASCVRHPYEALQEKLTEDDGSRRHTLLSGLNGCVKPGEMCLVLGPPGSGCSTLLRVLAGQREHLQVEGDILFNGSADYKHMATSFVIEEDIHLASLTVEETIKLAIEMALPLQYPNREKRIELLLPLVETVMGLYHIKDSIVGNNLLRGISGGEKKRLTIGELNTGPSSQLTCIDGWSTGLDSAAAYDILRSLRMITNLARGTVIVSQYQCSTEIFDLFDKLLLLKNGEQVYFGPAKGARAYFAGLGLACPATRTVPDFLATVTDRNLVPVMSESQLLAEKEETSDRETTPDEVRVTVLGGNETAGPRPSDPPGYVSSIMPPPISPVVIGDETNWEGQASSSSGNPSRRKVQIEEPEVRFEVVTDYEPEALEKSAPPVANVEPPKDLAGFAQAFRESEEFATLQQELKDARDKTPESPGLGRPMPQEVRETMLEHTYRTPFRHQLKKLTEVETLLMKNAKKITVFPRIGAHVFMALLLGSLFWDLDLSVDGANSRASVLFQAQNFVSFAAFGLIGQFFEARRVFYKHRKAKMYHPMAWFLSRTVADIPLSIVETIVFTSILYWMVGLYANVTAFLFCMLVLWLMKMVISNVIRLMSVVMPDASSAQAALAGLILLWIFYSGFMIHADDVSAMWAWAPYVSPLAFGFHALAVNEYENLTFECDPDDLVPSISFLEPVMGNQTDYETYQVCNIPGPPSGARTGLGYLEARYGVKQASLKWVDIAILLGMLAGVLVLSALAVVKIDHANASHSMKYKHRSLKGIKRQESKQTLLSGKASMRDFGTCKGAYFTWSHLQYSVPRPGSRRKPRSGGDDSDNTLQLLQDVFGYCKPCSLTALMGSSGAGKTTLLDVLAQRKTGGKISGDVRLNGKHLTKGFARVSGYVEQADIHNSRSTVQEALKFAARLRLPVGTSNDQIDTTVENTLHMLRLVPYRDAMIGEPESSGLPLDVRKRLTIAVELVANPSLLFLDEPTSGLDTIGALSVMKAVKRIAESGRAVICTIHQPSTEIFELFDNILLLARGGRTVYFGPLGPSCSTLLNYFERNGAHRWQAHQNPAEYMLEVIGAGIAKRTVVNDWGEVWLQSNEFKELFSLFRRKELLVPESATPFAVNPKTYPPVFQQFKALLARSFRTYWRTPSYNLTRNIISVGIAFMFGSSYWQLGNSQSDMFATVTAVFFTVFNGILAMMDASTYMFTDRAVFYHETAAGVYRPLVYAITSAIVELPFILLSGALFWNIYFFMLGFDVSTYGFAFVDYLCFSCVGVFLGQAISAALPALEVAMQVIPLLLNLWMLTVGFFITESAMPPYFIPLNILNPFKYYIRSVLTTVMHGQEYMCDPNEFLRFPVPPDGCPEAPSVSLDEATEECKLCPNMDGDAFLDFYSWSYSTRWTDVLILIGLMSVVRLLTIVLLTNKRHMKR